MFENHRKSLIQHCDRSELRLHLSGQKVIKNAKNGQFWQVLKTLCLQSNSVTRHDRSISKGQKWFENSKIKWDISSYFQRVWIYLWISVASFSNDPFIETIHSSYSWRNSIGVVISISNAGARVTKTCQWKIQKYEYDKKIQHFAK